MQYTIDVNTRQALASIAGLTSALKGLAGAFAIREIVQFSDGITNLRNKLLTLTPDIETVNRQFQALASIATTARTPLESTADLFFRIQRSAKALGISQREAAQITESVAKALTASGQSASEAAGPLLQLGQALQSGTFQGDELRSILEGLPQVATALAQELNVPVGALKKLGSEGQISADVFVRAMRRAKDSIDEAFGRTIPTIGQSVEGFRTVIKLLADDFEQNSKTGQNLARMIQYITVQIYNSIRSINDFIDRWGDVILTIGQVILAFTAFRLISATIGFVVGGLRTLARSIGDIVDVVKNKGIGPIQQAAERLVRLGKEATATGTIFSTVTLIIGRFVGMISALVGGIATFLGLGSLIDKMKELGDSTSEANKEIEDFNNSQKNVTEGLDDTASKAENMIQRNKELAQTYARLKLASQLETDNLRQTLADTSARLELENILLTTRDGQLRVSKEEADLIRQSQEIDQERARAAKQITDQIVKLQLEYSQLAVTDSKRGDELSAQIGVLQEQLKTTREIYDQHRDRMQEFLKRSQEIKIIEEARVKDNERLVKLIEDQTTRAQSLGNILQGVGRQIQEELAGRPDKMVGFSSIQKRFIEIEEAARKSARAAAAQFAQGFEMDDIANPEMASQFVTGLDAITQAYGRLVEVQKQSAEETYRIQRTFEYGWRDALAKFAEDAFDRANEAKTYFNTFVSGFESAITRFVQTGKLSFKDLISSLIADFARIQARRMLFNFLGASGLGSLFGGGGTAGASVLGLPGFARGGYLPSGQMGIVGENGPELITGPANITPQMQPQAMNVTYNINAVDAQSFRTLVARDPQFIYSVTEAGRRAQPTRRLS